MLDDACDSAASDVESDGGSDSEAAPTTATVEPVDASAAPSLGSLVTVASGSGGGGSTSECGDFSADDQSDEAPMLQSQLPQGLLLLQQQHHGQGSLGRRPAQQTPPRKRSNAISAKSMSSYLNQYKEAKRVYFDGVLVTGLMQPQAASGRSLLPHQRHEEDGK